MKVVHIRKLIESETLHLPELKPLVGRTVEIVVYEAASTPDSASDAMVRPGTGDWEAAARAARELRDGGYDVDAWRRQRDFDVSHANNHLQ